MMRAEGFSLILLFLLLVGSVESLNRSSFPTDFLFGTSSSSYQYEGAANEGGRGPQQMKEAGDQVYGILSLRDIQIKDQSNGVLAVDSYHRFKEDVAIMKDIGFNAYRFSISWSRVLPGGNLKGGVNREGITFYNNLINELMSNGLQPFVTLFHWDLPQALEDEYGGFINPNIVVDFTDYAELCYREFGDRVKHWITINEPNTFSMQGYANGMFAPGRCSRWLSMNCTVGDSSTEPYLVAHHQILAHAAAVKVYRDKYQISQKGQIGITLNSPWVIPLSPSQADKDAATRAIVFTYDWFMEPLNSGLYPAEMVNNAGERLPKFSKEQSLMVKGSFDFIGLNYYSAYYAANVPCRSENRTIWTDSCANLTTERNGVLLGPKAASDWLHIYPQGIQDLLLYTREKFNNPVIYITENGVDELNDGTKSLEDNIRVDYISRHLSYVHSAIMKGVNVKGYLSWSLLDNFEWADGYTVRFGMVYIDYKDELKRYPKNSAEWFKKFLH